MGVWNNCRWSQNGAFIVDSPPFFMGMNYLKLYVLLETIGKKKKKNDILHTLGIT